MRTEIQFTHDNQSVIRVSAGGGDFGEIARDVDGYWYFWMKEVPGAWSEWIVSAIAQKMRELNAEWDNQVKSDLSKPESVYDALRADDFNNQ